MNNFVWASFVLLFSLVHYIRIAQVQANISFSTQFLLSLALECSVFEKQPQCL